MLFWLFCLLWAIHLYYLFVLLALKCSPDECISHTIWTATPVSDTPPPPTVHSHFYIAVPIRCAPHLLPLKDPAHSFLFPNWHCSNFSPTINPPFPVSTKQSDCSWQLSETADGNVGGVVAEAVCVPVPYEGECHHTDVLVSCWLLQTCCKLVFSLCRV